MTLVNRVLVSVMSLDMHTTMIQTSGLFGAGTLTARMATSQKVIMISTSFKKLISVPKQTSMKLSNTFSLTP